MAGKRPDQYQITPREAGTSDYKRSSEIALGNDADSDVRQGDKQRFVQSRENAEGQPFLPDVPAPSAEANRAAQARDGRRPADEAQGGVKEPPHVTENIEGAPVQKDVEGAGDAPVLPPNASGKDRFSEQKHDRPIDPESAYDRRPEEDKNWDPGDRT